MLMPCRDVLQLAVPKFPIVGPVHQVKKWSTNTLGGRITAVGTRYPVKNPLQERLKVFAQKTGKHRWDMSGLQQTLKNMTYSLAHSLNVLYILNVSPHPVCAPIVKYNICIKEGN